MCGSCSGVEEWGRGQCLTAMCCQDGVSVMAEFTRADMSRVRNKSAYLSGVVSRVKDER